MPDFSKEAYEYVNACDSNGKGYCRKHQRWLYQCEKDPELDYPAAARAIALWLKPFCNKDLTYPNMIAGAAREAAIRITQLEDTLRALVHANPNDGTWNYQAAWSSAYKLLNSDKNAQGSDTTEASSENQTPAP